MFGTSGIRGIYGKDITESLAMKVANVFAGKKLAVARDIRKSGLPLLQAACAGALSAGSGVIDLGIVPTPTVALATKKYGCRGIMITASHNPPEYNGLKLIENSKEIGKGTESEVAKAYRETPHRLATPGKLSEDGDIIGEHKMLVKNLVDAELIKKKKPKIIVDCNGAAAVITPSLLSELGCDVIAMNTSLEEFARPSEPNEKNLAQLAKRVSSAAADFGIGHDGDGDRCVIVDDTGAVLPLDVQLAIMIEHELERSDAKKEKRKKKKTNKKIISTVEASLVIREVVENAGGEIEITPVGSTFVADALEAGGAVFGGEPCGEYIYRNGVHVPDAVLAAAKFAEIFCLKGKFSKLKTLYPQHFMAREKFPAKDKHATVEKIKKQITAKLETGNRKLRTDDGIRVDEDDGWLLIRASGTEPIVRLTMEYKTKEKLERRKEEMTRRIKTSL